MDLKTSPLATSNDYLDWEALNRRCLGRVDLIGKALARFQENYDRDLGELERAAVATDGEEIARVAHRLKGALLTISANRLAETVSELEGDCDEDLAEVEDRLNEVRVQCRHLSELIGQYLKGADG